MRVPIFRSCTALAILALLAFASCGGGGGGTGGISGEDTAKDLVLIDVSVADFDGVPLNEWIDFEFSEALDPDSVRPDTIQIREGPNYGKQVPGFFRVGIEEEGKDGRFVRFYPRLPTLDTLADGGLQPGTPYRIILPGVPKVETVKNFTGDRLVNETSVNFQTALAGSANLFTDNFLDEYIPGISPGVVFVNPPHGAEDVSSDVQITATFTRRPLNPATVNSTNITLTMVERKGRVWNRPIPGTPVLEQGFDRVTVTFVPQFPLSDEALYKLHVDRRVQDLVGNDVAPLDTEFTIIDEPYKENALTLNFTAAEKVAPLNYMDKDETTGSWDEAIEGALVALFTIAGGMGTSGDLTPLANETRTPDNTPGVEFGVYEDGVYYDVFNFRKIEIPQGVTVRIQGNYSNSRRGLTDSDNHAIKIMALFPIKIEGVLNVSGGDGSDAETSTSNSALPYGYGGIAGPGGGHGANAYTGSGPSGWDGASISKLPVMDGVSPSSGNDAGNGGYFGSSMYGSYVYAGGGGGGAGGRTAGFAGKKGGYPSTGYYGDGGLGGSAIGGNLERNPHYGGAGGGAGTMAFYYSYPYRNAAGGGGGGGGAATLQSGASITISSTGKIMSDGGNGGSCAKSYYIYYGGAGGGGAGGSVKLRSTTGITLEPGATISVAGGAGGAFLGTYSYYAGGQGGNGGEGWIRLEAPSPKDDIVGINTATLTYGSPSTGTFFPVGGGAPSIGQTNWLNLGVFDPEMLEWKPLEHKNDSPYNDQIHYYVQLADENTAEPGTPDLSALDLGDADNDGEVDDPKAGQSDVMSEWTELADIRDLNGNGYQFIRVKIVFQLDAKQEFTHVLPYVDWLKVPFRY